MFASLTAVRVLPAAIILTLLSATDGLAQTSTLTTAPAGGRFEVTPSYNRPAIGHLVENGMSGGSTPTEGESTRRGRPVARRAPVYYAYFPQLDTLPDGSRCVRVIRRGYPDPMSAAVAEDTENVLWSLTLEDYPPCPGAQAPVRTPATEAATFWRLQGEDLLPKPAPRIAPGYMLAGKLAYLETGATMATRFEHATPLGPLTIEATSTVFVDWGDGTGRDGPHAGPGGPWPNGTITHTWTTAKPYDVTVVQRWTATWRLGGTSGTLDGLTTEARIEDFPVRQLQAVRNV
jgi:hypothetical protein